MFFAYRPHSPFLQVSNSIKSIFPHYGRVTLTTQSTKNSAITLSCMNFSDYVQHETIFT